MQERDDQLLAQYRSGDASALEALVQAYRRPLFGYIMNMTEGRGDADEVFQEVWFRAIRKLDSFKGGNFFGWLVRIARNYVIDMSRKKKPELSLDRETEDGGSFLDRVPGTETGPERQTANTDLAERIRAAVAKLPDEQREVFVMRTKSQIPFKEIAEIQSVSINTALARMQYALSKLRDVLKDDYADLEGERYDT